MNQFFKGMVLVASFSLLGACGLTHHESNNNSQPKKQMAQDNSSKNPGTTAKSGSNSNSTESSQSSDPSHSQGSADSSLGKIQDVSDPTSITVLVNKTHKLPDGYVPPNLMYPNVPFPYPDLIEKREMRDVAAHALEKMFAAAKTDGINLLGVSGYRSYSTQKAIFDYNVKTQGYAKASIVSAVPGTSEHQTGLAIDISATDVQDDLVQAFGSTSEGEWVAKHAHEYGFIIRYQKGKENITGYEYEPWHIRYVGVAVATDIYKHNWTLEQYLAQKGK